MFFSIFRSFTTFLYILLSLFTTWEGEPNPFETELAYAYTVTNPHKFPIHFQMVNTPFRIGNPFLTLHLEEKEVTYHSAVRYHAPPYDNIYLYPSQSITVYFILDKYYNISAPGEYKISVHAFYEFSEDIPVETHLGPATRREEYSFSLWSLWSFWSKITFQQEESQKAKLPMTNTILVKKDENKQSFIIE